MKKQNIFNFSITLVIAAFLLLACNASTANLSSFKTSKDKEGKSESTSFKLGETLYANAIVSNNIGKVKVKLYLVDGKNETLKGSEVSVDIDGDSVANYKLDLPEGLEVGAYKLNADMINEAGEKKDSKSASVTITE